MSYASAIELVNAWSERLRRRGANGSILVVEEAFQTTVASHPLFPADHPFTGGHDRSQEDQD
jgi:hypothetical protein